MSIPFIPDEDTKAGICYSPKPRLRRVVADNPGPFTYTGTGTYIIGTGIIGTGTLGVIDPGPMDERHLNAILSATEGEDVSHIFITHTHRDHSPLAHPLAERTGAHIVGCPPLNTDAGTKIKVEEAFDHSYQPDIVLEDGACIEGSGWTLKAIATPGHTSNHLCFHWVEENALFTGDHIMGWSTTVIAPPDGDMQAYMDSLYRIERDSYQSFWPTHGRPIMTPKPFLKALIQHRLDREAEILDQLQKGVSKIPEIVRALYTHIPAELHPAAALSVYAHLIKLHREGQVQAKGGHSLEASYTL